MSDSEHQHEHERIRQDLAGYVIGGLTLDEQHAVEAHLLDCALCREELEELDPLPVLLELSAIGVQDGPVATAASTASTLTPELVGAAAVGSGADDRAPTAPPAEPPHLIGADRSRPVAAPEPPPARSTNHARRSNRTRRGMAVGAAALALAAAFLVGLVVAGPHEPAYSAPVALHAAGGSTATGTVAVRREQHGTDVKLIVQGLPASTTGTYYECIWWSDTRVRSAGTFRAAPRGHTEVELVTAADLEPGWHLEILEHPDGQPKPVAVLTSPT